MIAQADIAAAKADIAAIVHAVDLPIPFPPDLAKCLRRVATIAFAAFSQVH